MGELLDVLGALRLEDGRRWGEAATPEQIADARAVLDPEPEHRRHWLGRSRGYSKTTDAAGFSVAALAALIPAGERGFCVAADADQAALVVEAIAGFVQRTPGLAQAVEVEAWKVRFPDRGTVVEVLSSDAPSAWGRRGWWWVCDELTVWPETRSARRFFEAVSTSWPKVPASRVLIISTAGSPSHWSRRVYEAAQDDPAWRVSDVHGPPPWVDPAEIEAERARLPASSFARLWENRWVEAEDRLTTIDALRDAVTLDGEQEPTSKVRYVVSVDVGLKNDATAVAVCHRDGERVVLDRMETWQGSRARPVSLEAVESWIVEASGRYNHAPVVADPYQAAQLIERLRRRGVRAREFVFSAQSVGRLAMGLYRRLRERTLALYDDEELLDELAHVRLRESSPGVYRLDHDSDRHDDRAVALALAIEALGTSRHGPARSDAGMVAESRIPTVAVGSVGGGREVRFGDGRTVPVSQHRLARRVDEWRRSR